MSTRELQGRLKEIHGAAVSPQLISTITDAVAAEVAEWQSRPLEPLHSVMFFDALRVKVRDQGTVCNKAAYLASGITPDGRKPVLGVWIDPHEGAKFWLRIINELRNRGVRDILIAVVDGLKGFPEVLHHPAEGAAAGDRAVVAVDRDQDPPNGEPSSSGSGAVKATRCSPLATTGDLPPRPHLPQSDPTANRKITALVSQ